MKQTLGLTAAAILCLASAGASGQSFHKPFFANQIQLRTEESDGVYSARTLADLDTWIAAVNAAPQVGTPQKLDFSAKMNFAHSSMIRQVPLSLLIAYADQLKAAGADRIDINPAVDIWATHDQATIDKYAALARHIHEIGLQISWEPTTITPMMKFDSFAQWQAVALPAYAEMARLIKPDIFVVAHEPTNLADWLHVDASVDDWAKFVEDAANVVKSASPTTKVGAGVYNEEEAYFDRFAAIKALDLVTMDIYFLDKLPVFARMAQTAHADNKEVVIEETWRWLPRRIGGKIVHDDSNQIDEAIDHKWLEAMTLFAVKYGLTGMDADRTEPFFLYTPGPMDTSDPQFIKQVANAILTGHHTGTFDKYRELSEKYGK